MLTCVIQLCGACLPFISIINVSCWTLHREKGLVCDCPFINKGNKMILILEKQNKANDHEQVKTVALQCLVYCSIVSVTCKACIGFVHLSFFELSSFSRHFPRSALSWSKFTFPFPPSCSPCDISLRNLFFIDSSTVRRVSQQQGYISTAQNKATREKTRDTYKCTFLTSDRKGFINVKMLLSTALNHFNILGFILNA